MLQTQAHHCLYYALCVCSQITLLDLCVTNELLDGMSDRSKMRKHASQLAHRHVNRHLKLSLDALYNYESVFIRGFIARWTQLWWLVLQRSRMYPRTTLHSWPLSAVIACPRILPALLLSQLQGLLVCLNLIVLQLVLCYSVALGCHKRVPEWDFLPFKW